jgi:hypothetical protein
LALAGPNLENRKTEKQKPRKQETKKTEKQTEKKLVPL